MDVRIDMQRREALRRLGLLGVGAAAALRGGFALAQDAAAGFPSHPMRMVVPFAPGGGTDLLGRLIAKGLADSMGQPVVVDNRVGAGGMIGTEAIAKSPGDGHTLGFLSFGHSIQPALYAKLPYDPVRDFSAITLVCKVPNVICAHPSVKVKNIEDLLAQSLANPGKYSYGTSGVGTAAHLCGELLNSNARAKLQHVPYRGAGPAIVDIVSGQIPLGIMNVSTIMPYLKDGKAIPIAVTSVERSKVLPDVPSIAETIPGFEVPEWYALAGPRGVHPAIAEKLQREIRRIVLLAANRANLEDNLGMQLVAGTPGELSTFMADHASKWTPFARQLGLQPQ